MLPRGNNEKEEKRRTTVSNNVDKKGNTNISNKSKREEESLEEDSSEEGDSEQEGESSEEEESVSWIQWFCSLRGNELLCEVDEDYIQDDFNLTGLSSQVPHYDYALDWILDTETDEEFTEEQQEVIEAAAEMLYGLIHSRYVLSNRGLASMAEKYNNVEFGRCPRVYCQGQPVLPVGQSDVPRTNTVKIFCPKCQDIYSPKLKRHSNIDGAYFGTTLPHLFFQTYPELVPPKPVVSYVPRIYGFKIYKPLESDTITTPKIPSTPTTNSNNTSIPPPQLTLNPSLTPPSKPTSKALAQKK